MSAYDTDQSVGKSPLGTRISAETPDWSREALAWFEWSPSKRLLLSIRDYQRHHASKSPLARIVSRRAAVLRHRFWSVVCAADIPLNCKLGGGLLLPHPNGIVIHPNVEIGPNCLIFQQVTLGAASSGVPKTGGHVDIGAGAKILGSVTLGNHSKIGANAVVLCDVPDRATAIGIPAKILVNR